MTLDETVQVVANSKDKHLVRDRMEEDIDKKGNVM